MFLVAWESKNYGRNFTTCESKNDLLSVKETLYKCPNVDKICIGELIEDATREERYKIAKANISSVYGMVVSK